MSRGSRASARCSTTFTINEATHELTRRLIDQALTVAGWVVLDISDTNLDVSRGVMIREFPVKTGQGFVYYALFICAPGRPRP